MREASGGAESEEDAGPQGPPLGSEGHKAGGLQGAFKGGWLSEVKSRQWHSGDAALRPNTSPCELRCLGLVTGLLRAFVPSPVNGEDSSICLQEP